jgi:hypothetical protein
MPHGRLYSGENGHRLLQHDGEGESEERCAECRGQRYVETRSGDRSRHRKSGCMKWEASSAVAMAKPAGPPTAMKRSGFMNFSVSTSKVSSMVLPLTD